MSTHTVNRTCMSTHTNVQTHSHLPCELGDKNTEMETYKKKNTHTQRKVLAVYKIKVRYIFPF